MFNSVSSWWYTLCTITCLNILLLGFSFFLLNKKKRLMDIQVLKIRNWQLLLSSIYVFGCGFRSIFPRGDIRRIVLHDHWISSVAIGRSVATIAELSFVLQWCFILYEIGKFTKDKTIVRLTWVPIYLIIIAELFSWYACISTNYIGTAIEESLWAIAASIMIFGLYKALPYYQNVQKKFLQIGIFLSVMYVIYMVTVDVPAYVNGWLAAEEAGKNYLTINEGWHQVTSFWTATTEYSDWKYEMVWMTLYFSIAVWISMTIINAPFYNKNIKQ